MKPATRSNAWWYWLATLTALAWGVAGWEPGYGIAMGVTLIHAAHWLRRGHRPSSLPMQVRIAYLGILALGLWPPLSLLHWMQLAGTSALLVFDYCPLARALSLMPWNRRVPLTGRLVLRVLLAPPVRGSALALVNNAAQQ